MDLKNLPYRLHTLYNHLVVIADDMYTSSVFLCVSEKGSQMRLLRMAAYRFLIELTNARRLQEKFLIDIIRLDLIDVRGKLHNLISYLIQHDCDLPLLYRYNKGEEFMTYAQDIVEEENLDNEVPDDERSKEAMKVRQIEIEKYRSNFDDFRDCIERICDVIDKLLDDAQSLHRDENAMLMRMGEMEDYYIRNQWQKDMKELNATIEMVRNKYMDKHFNDIQILVFVQNELLYDNVNGIGHNELYNINKNWQNRAVVARMVTERRSKISFDDMMSHLRFYESERYLIELIETKKLMMPCNAYEGKLFTSLAAYELAQMLAKAFYNYVGFEKKLRSAFVCAAMIDFKMMLDDVNNNRLKAEFFNNEVLGDKDKQLSKDDVSKSLRSCTGRPFCTIDENNLRDFTIDEFNLYKDPYWRAFSIINKVTGLGDKIEKAPYLDSLHPIIADNDVVDAMDDDKKLKLKYIISALSQNWW